MSVFTEVMISRKELLTATSALAMTWATLRDVAHLEGIDIDRHFKREVKRFTMKKN